MSDQTQPVKTTKKILIVEDETFIRELYARILRNQGYEVEEAADGEAGFEAISNGKYDLVLLDIMLPKMDGIAILQRLQTEQHGKITTPIVVLSNLDEELTIAKSVALGIRGYIVKSQCSNEQLKREVENYLKMEENKASSTNTVTG